MYWLVRNMIGTYMILLYCCYYCCCVLWHVGTHVRVSGRAEIFWFCCKFREQIYVCMYRAGRTVITDIIVTFRPAIYIQITATTTSNQPNPSTMAPVECNSRVFCIVSPRYPPPAVNIEHPGRWRNHVTQTVSYYTLYVYI